MSSAMIYLTTFRETFQISPFHSNNVFSVLSWLLTGGEEYTASRTSLKFLQQIWSFLSSQYMKMRSSIDTDHMPYSIGKELSCLHWKIKWAKLSCHLLAFHYSWSNQEQHFCVSKVQSESINRKSIKFQSRSCLEFSKNSLKWASYSNQMS